MPHYAITFVLYEYFSVTFHDLIDKKQWSIFFSVKTLWKEIKSGWVLKFAQKQQEEKQQIGSADLCVQYYIC